MQFKGQDTYNHQGNPIKKGVLLVNLGTPDAPKTAELRKYLREFLSDPRVVEIPRVLWLIILYCFILPFRPKKSAKLYKSIWTEHGSPLLSFTQQQQQALQAKYDENYAGDMLVSVGMRYGNPSIKDALKELTNKNVRDITILPLYPQYSGATSGSTFDAIAKELTHYRWVPTIKFINGYHSHPLYISAIAQSIKDYINTSGYPDKLIFSYHGVPQQYLEQGDPYYCFCMQTTRLVNEYLSMHKLSVTTTFQSRFGKAAWLKPYTDETLKALAKDGHQHVAVICPGFASDCLETLEEIVTENKAYFIDSGGKTFDYIPCLNSQSDHITMMFSLTNNY
jgi:ferrochelatase